MRRVIYEVPRWHCFLHRDARGLERAEPTDPARQKFEDELFDRLYAGSAEPLPDAEKDARWGQWAENLHFTCEQLPMFSRLGEEVCGDAMATAAAVETLMEELNPVEPDALFQTSGKHQPPGQVRRQVARGCERASAVVEELREMSDGLGGVGFGVGGGASGPGQSAPFRQLADRLRRDDRLRRIALLAGRFKRIAATKRRQKVKHGADELADVEQGGELSRLLPAELAKFTRPKLRLALLRDLVERQAMQYRLSGSEELGKGPIIVALDKSGSMDGAPDLWATAVALALLHTAQSERRPFGLLCFNDCVDFEAVVQPSEKLPEHALFVGCGGGTDIGGVLGRGLELVREHQGQMKKADVVLITDGQSATDSATELRTLANELGVSILGVAIGMSADSLRVWCDEVESITNLSALADDVAETLFGR